MTRDDQAQGGELRRNPVNGKLTIVAPARATRPHGGTAGARGARAAGPAAGQRRRPRAARSARATRA